jgi:hypothetical protein
LRHFPRLFVFSSYLVFFLHTVFHPLSVSYFLSFNFSSFHILFLVSLSLVRFFLLLLCAQLRICRSLRLGTMESPS